MKVYLQDVVDEISMQSDESMAYLNCKTGELYTVAIDTLSEIENEDEVEFDSLPNWQREEYAKAAEILDSEEWQRLPTKFDIHEYQMMAEFSSTYKDPFIQELLSNAIRGNGAFRTFKMLVHQYGIQDEWYKYRDEAYENIAIKWLDEHGVAYIRGRRTKA